jgi:hypothetical protein
MVCLQAADGGTASNMECSFEYTEYHGQWTRGGPPAWGLGEVLRDPHHKNVSFYEMFTQKVLDPD